MKSYRRRLLHLSLIASAMVTIIGACKKQITPPINQAQKLKIFLTDDPAQFDQLPVDIRMVEVCVEPYSRIGEIDDDNNDDHGGQDNQGDHDGETMEETTMVAIVSSSMVPMGIGIQPFRIYRSRIV